MILHRAFFYCRLFVLGYLLILLVHFKTRDDVEDRYFTDLATALRASRPAANEDSAVLDALHLTHHLLAERALIFTNQRLHPMSSYDGSLTEDLLTGQGACGSYANVLGELLRHMGFTVRIGQMKVNGLYGGHIITECLTAGGWVALDAMYDQYFVTLDHRLASCRQVIAAWDYYRHQTRPGYDSDYCYADVRYTNWQKLPVVMPALKRLLTLCIGSDRTNSICLGTLFLRRYRAYYLLLLFVLLGTAVFFVICRVPAVLQLILGQMVGLSQQAPVIPVIRLLRH